MDLLTHISFMLTDGDGASHVGHCPVVTYFHSLGIHRDTFDLDSFFQLHDLNRYVIRDIMPPPDHHHRDGFWDHDEIQAIYGVHHVYSQKKSRVGIPRVPLLKPTLTSPLFVQDEIEHQKKADHVVDTVLKSLDKNSDGKISPEEFTSAGYQGMPTFDDIGVEGHHYDVESGMSAHDNHTSVHLTYSHDINRILPSSRG